MKDYIFKDRFSMLEGSGISLASFMISSEDFLAALIVAIVFSSVSAYFKVAK